MGTADFNPVTLPWIDRPTFPEELEVAVGAGRISSDQAERLCGWDANGFLQLPRAIPHDLVDQLLTEYEEAWQARPTVRVLVEGQGVQLLPEVAERSSLTHHHYRFMDFQDVSDTARKIMLHPKVVEHLRLIFGEAPVAMQSLLFEYGSEQHIHQDFPFVQAKVPSHLVGCWVALEDMNADNGPLFYYPGSHRRPKFDFGGTLAYDGKDPEKLAAFERFLAEETCSGLERATFHARKGDVFLWHAALVHGGSPAIDRELTRKSFVCHYSTLAAYPRDQRAPRKTPVRYEANGGVLYEPPAPATGFEKLVDRVRGRLERLRK